jgi:hypothetical protein
MLNLLRQPYPCTDRSAQRWRVVIGMGAFVAFFLFVFSPFGLGRAPVKERLLLCLGYGLLCSVVMTLNQFVVPALFPKAFQEERWTVGKQILWSGFNFGTVAVGNFLFTAALGYADFSGLNLFYFVLVTLAVGIIPVTGFVLLDYLRLMRLHLKEAQRLTALIPHPAVHANSVEMAPPASADKEATIPTSELTRQLISLTEENGREALRLPASDLLALLTADNYVEAFCLRNGRAEKVLLRSSLKRLEEEALAEYPGFFRCHRTCLVNLSRVEEVLGNSQGCRLRLNGMEMQLPVSRGKVAELEARLQAVAVRP